MDPTTLICVMWASFKYLFAEIRNLPTSKLDIDSNSIPQKADKSSFAVVIEKAYIFNVTALTRNESSHMCIL